MVAVVTSSIDAEISSIRAGYHPLWQSSPLIDWHSLPTYVAIHNVLKLAAVDVLHAPRTLGLYQRIAEWSAGVLKAAIVLIPYQSKIISQDCVVIG